MGNGDRTDHLGRGERRTIRLGCGTTIAVATAMVCCGFLSVLPYVQQLAGPPSSSAAAPAIAAPIDGSVVLELGDQSILYTDAQGFCHRPQLSVVETATVVRLTYSYTEETLADCARLAGVVPLNTVSVALDGPLGDRRVVDATSGRNLPVFRQRDALHPGRMPKGYGVFDGGWGAVTSAVSDFGDDRSATIGERFSLSSTSAPSGLITMWIVETTGTGWHPPAGTSTVPVTVRGRVGRAAAGIIVWTEAGRTVAIRWDPPAGLAPASTPFLVALAAGLV